MLFFRKYAGMALIVVGVASLAVLHLARFTMVNALLLLPLSCIVAGIVTHVFFLKRESPY